jgi:hypothetical protein
VVALLVFAGWLWGPHLAALVKAQTQSTTEEFREVGDHIRSGVDRRSGAGLDEGTP